MFHGNRLSLGRTRPLGLSIPASIGNLVRWGDPTKANTINDGFPADGDPVSTSRDRHGSNDLTQGVGVDQPIWKTTYNNFVSSDLLESASSAFDKSTADAFSALGWFKNTGTGVQVLMGKWGVAGQQSYALQYNSGWKAFGSTNGTAFVGTSSVGTGSGAWVFLALVYDADADLLKISLNGGAFGTVALSSLHLSTLDYELSSTAFPFTGESQQDFFYSKALSLSEINTLKSVNPPV